MSRLEEPRFEEADRTTFITCVVVFVLCSVLIPAPPADEPASGAVPRRALERRNAAERMLERDRPEVVLVGNSVSISAYDTELLERLCGLVCRKICWGGSYSPWWFLVLKNLVARHNEAVASGRSPGPAVRFAVFTFRFHHLTEAALDASVRSETKLRAFSDTYEPELTRLLYRRGRCGVPWFVYRFLRLSRARPDVRLGLSRIIKHEIAAALAGMRPEEIEPALDEVLADERMDRELMTIQQREAERERRGRARSFLDGLGESFLPRMIEVASDAGLTLVFVRARTRLEVEAGKIDEGERKYLDELGTWLGERGAVLLDLSTEPSITVDCFADEHHYNAKGRRVLSRLLADCILRLMPTAGQGGKARRDLREERIR